MSLVLNCIGKLEADKKISRDRADRMRREARRIEASLDGAMSVGEREAFVAAELGKVLSETAREQKRRAAMNAIALTEALDAMTQHKKGMGSGLNAILTRDVREQVGQSIESRRTALYERVVGMMDDAFENYSNRLSGLLPALHDIKNVIREGFGENTGDEAAKRAWTGWDKGVKELVRRAKAAGKTFQEDDAWRFPQSWNPRAIRGQRDAFRADVMEAIESGGLVLLDEDGVAVSAVTAPARVNEVLRRIVEDVGKSVDQPLNPAGRSFVFKNAQTWLAMQGKYGNQETDLFSTMMGHLNNMATEVAFLERLGPSWRQNFALLHERAKASENDTGMKSTIFGLDQADSAMRSFAYLAGDANAVESEIGAAVMGSVRATLSSAQLGSALLISVPSDSMTAAAASLRSGLPIFNVLGKAFYDAIGDTAEKRAMARQIGVVTDMIAEQGLSALRNTDVDAAPRFFSALASFVQRASFMQRWTRVAKRAFQMEFLGHIASLAQKRFDELPDATKRFLEQNGLAKEWDAIRAGEVVDYKGAKFFNMNSLEGELQERFRAAMIDERSFAILEPDARVKGATTQGLRRGTFGGEAMRTIMQYKSFPITMMMTYGHRARNMGWKGVRYMAGFSAMLALAGAAGIQARQVAQGKDFREMNPVKDPAFWADAFFTGGALGILGDLNKTMFSRAGTPGFVTNLAGPGVGFLESVAALGYGSIREGLDDGTPAKFQTQLARFVRRNTPGSTLWYSRLLTDRLIFDTMQEIIDPDYRKSFRRIEQRAKKDYGQSFWWRPGASAPGLAPN